MRYLGGKFRIKKPITEYINTHIQSNQIYLEPFVGAGWVLSGINTKLRFASDVNQALITMWIELQNGWNPPTTITEDEYNIINGIKDPLDPLTAFVGFGCSYSGKWFGGYARDNTGRSYASNARNSLLKKYPKIMDVRFDCLSYDEWNPSNCFIYCDPPYVNTTKYNGTDSFNNEEFWNVMRKWSYNNVVLISEYTAPVDFSPVLEIVTKTDMRVKTGGKEPRIEKLFKIS